EGRYAPETTEGRRLLAHELAHTVQTASAPELVPVVRRFDAAKYKDLGPVEAVGKALTDKNEDDSFALMNQLTKFQDATDVLLKYQKEAVKAYNNKEMGKATKILVGKGARLDLALDWMFDEGTNWDLLKDTITACTDDNFKKNIVLDKYRDLFAKELNKKDM